MKQAAESFWFLFTVALEVSGPLTRAEIYDDSTLIRGLCLVMERTHLLSLRASKALGPALSPQRQPFRPPPKPSEANQRPPPEGRSWLILQKSFDEGSVSPFSFFNLKPNVFLSVRTLIFLQLLPESTCGKRFCSHFKGDVMCGGQTEEEHLKSDLQTGTQALPHGWLFRQVQGRSQAGPGPWYRPKVPGMSSQNSHLGVW